MGLLTGVGFGPLLQLAACWTRDDWISKMRREDGLPISTMETDLNVSDLQESELASASRCKISGLGIPHFSQRY